MKRTKVIDVLRDTEYGKKVCVKGWVRTHRSSKAVDFIALNDGSTITSVQVVVDPAAIGEEKLKLITTGSCICVVGTLVESPAQGQSSEIQCESIEIYGTCGADYPMQKKGQSFEYMRQHAHLRLRTNVFGAIMRIRHNMAMAIHTYFHEHGFFYFHTPLITASDCEGAGNMFQVTTKNLYDLKRTMTGKSSTTMISSVSRPRLRFPGSWKANWVQRHWVPSTPLDPLSAQRTLTHRAIWQSFGW